MKRAVRILGTVLAVLAVGAVAYGVFRGPSGPRPAPGPFPDESGYTPVDSGSDSLTIATWNLRWLNRPGRGEVRRDRSDYGRLARVAEELDADILAVQEVYDRGALERVLDPRVYTFHLSRRWSEQRVGFAVKRGLEVERHPDLERLSEVGAGDRRGVDLSIERRGGSLRLLSLHLASGCIRRQGLPPAVTACRELTRQARILADWIDAREAAGDEFVLVGDFNRDYGPDDPFWSRLDRAASRAGTALVKPGRGETPACRDGRFPTFIDHLVLDRDVVRRWSVGPFDETTYASVLEDTSGRLSDHCPVSIELRGGPPAGG